MKSGLGEQTSQTSQSCVKSGLKEGEREAERYAAGGVRGTS